MTQSAVTEKSPDVNQLNELHDLQEQLIKLQIMKKYYDLDSDKFTTKQMVYGKFVFVFLLFRCVKNEKRKMTGEKVHVNTCIDLLFNYLDDFQFKFNKGFQVRFQGENDHLCRCDF